MMDSALALRLAFIEDDGGVPIGTGGTNNTGHPPATIYNSANNQTACRCITETIFDAQGNCSCAEPATTSATIKTLNNTSTNNLLDVIKQNPIPFAIIGGLIGYAIIKN